MNLLHSGLDDHVPGIRFKCLERRVYQDWMTRCTHGLMGFVYALIGLGGVLAYADRPLLAALFGGPFLVIAAVVLRGAYRVATITDDVGVEARWLLKTKRVAWRDVAAFEPLVSLMVGCSRRGEWPAYIVARLFRCRCPGDVKTRSTL